MSRHDFEEGNAQKYHAVSAPESDIEERPFTTTIIGETYQAIGYDIRQLRLQQRLKGIGLPSKPPTPK